MSAMKTLSIDEQSKPTLGQVSFLKDTLKMEEWIKVQFDTETIFSALSEIDLDTFNSIKWHYTNNKKLILREKLLSIGVKSNKLI